VGSAVSLGGRQVTVVGLVENPQNLHDEFALTPPANTTNATGTDPFTSVTVLARADTARFAAFRAGRSQPLAYTRPDQSTRAPAATGALVLATVALLLVSLVAAAGFAAVAQRRLRQIGMLAAVGATDKHLRLVLIAHGAVIGVIASVAGTAAGLLLWLGLAPRLDTSVGHRIDPLTLPWSLIAIAALVAIATPTAAAWWPARAMARIPVTLALSARPPRPNATTRSSAVVTTVCLAAGATCLALSHRSNPLLVITGIVAIVAGMLLVSPLVIRVLARTAGRTPVAVRIALRDLGRYQARSGAALAAISLALGIAVGVIVAAAIAENTAAQGNLPDTQLIVRVTNGEALIAEPTPAELSRIRSAVDRYAGTLGHASVIPLEMAADTSRPPEPASEDGPGGRPAVEAGSRFGSGGGYHSVPLYVATPELAAHLGIDLSTAEPGTDILTNRAGPLEIVNVAKRGLVAKIQRIDGTGYSSAPNTLLTPGSLQRGGWKAVPVGWLIQATRPLRATQVTAARDMAVGAGLTVETRRDQGELRIWRSGATVGGAILALGVLAMTVGTIRGEAAAELRALTATGATRGIRRTLTAVTAGALALAGVLLGVAGAYLCLVAAYLGDLGTLSRVPIVELAVTIVGVPVLAAATGWLVAGREPDTIGRRLLE
jgi:putative ABC transport system permease protein